MKNVYRVLMVLIFSFLLIISNSSFGQSTSNIRAIATDESSLEWLILKSNITVNSTDFFSNYKEQLGFKSYDEFNLVKSETDDLGFKHNRFNQSYKGIKIEDAQYILHSKNNRVLRGNGNIIPGLNLNTTPVISEKEALSTALGSIETKNYAWGDSNQVNIWVHNQNKKSEDLFPHGQLIIAYKSEFPKSANNFYLAWYFEIRMANISNSRKVFINANTNELIKSIPITIECVPTYGETTWHGNQPIKTSSNGTNYILHEQCFTHGDIHTVNYSQCWNCDYFDADNTWTSNNKSAVTSHHYSRRTLDFYFDYFNRNSFDNAGSALYVYNDWDTYPGPNNARWDGSNGIYFGNGNTSSANDDWNTIDIVGHEITHGVTQSSNGLNYIGESGALNEAFSDIFGTAVERYFEGDCCYDWFIGEDRNGGNLWTRSLADPKNWGAHLTTSGTLAIGQPNTYGGNYWYTTTGCTSTSQNDNCGVHINSGVLNHWFYLLSQGGSGTNDNGFSYSFTGIGFNDAILIAYRTLRFYLSPASVYGDAKTGSIQSAIDLFNSGSNQHNKVIEAWCAVGLGTGCSASGCTPPNTPITNGPGNPNYPGTTVSSLTPTFDWNTVAGATDYKLSISVYPFGSSNIIYSQCVGNPPFNIPSGTLSNNNYYRWDVQANISCGICVSGFSSDRYFNTSLTTGNQPNLYVASSTMGMTGNIANYTYSIGNNGTANAGGFSINFYACTSSTFTNPILLGSDYVSQLVVSSNLSGQKNIDFCSLGLADGSYYLGFYIDYNNQISESNENDNNQFSSSTSYPVNCTTGSQPNLYLLTAAAGTNGNLATFGYNVSNNGTSAAGSFIINFYACSTNVFTNPIWVGSETINQGLSIGASYSSQSQVDLCNVGLITGSYYLGIYIDYSNQVNETNESDNNTFYNSLALPINCGGSGGCTFSISPTTGHAPFLFGGGSDWTALTTSNSTCTWTATTPNNWITILDSTGTGNATINYQVATNPSPNPRTGFIDIEGQMCIITQYGQECPVSISPLSDSLSNTLGDYSFHITLGLGCGYSVSTNDPSWLTITSVIGDTIVNYHVTNNGGPTRTGVITVDTALHYIYQSGTDSIPISNFYADDILPVPFQTVHLFDLSTHNPNNWFWSISPTTYTFLNNTNLNSRNPEVMFTDTGYYTIMLQAINSGGFDIELKNDYLHVQNCSYSIDSISHYFNFNGGIGVVQVSDLNGASCGWIAPAVFPNWVHIIYPTTMVHGNDQVIYSVDTCAGAFRNGTITIAGNIHNIFQDCAVTTNIESSFPTGDVIIFPNPSDEYINILGYAVPNNKYNLTISNLLGEKVEINTFEVYNHSIERKISIKELVSGIYFIVVEAANYKHTFKIEKL